MTQNMYLEGPFAPIKDETTEFDLKVRGQIPKELSGRLLRIGPNPIAPDPKTHHWFVGSGMVHGVTIKDGKALSYRSRYVRDDAVVAHDGGKPVEGPEGLLGNGAVNTNVVEIAGELYAIVEAGGYPVQLDDELDTVRRSDFDGTLKNGFTAHPKVDPDTGDLHATTYSPFDENAHHVVVGANGLVTRDEPINLPHKPMIHDCAITENYFIVLDFPCVFDPGALADGAALPYRWHPELEARVGLLPREGDGSEVRWFSVDTCYVFHPMNAYEDEHGNVVMDVVRHPAMFATDFRGPNEGPATLDRWTFDLQSGNTKEERIDDRGQEFPRIDERLIGKPHRYGYTGAFGSSLQASGLHKYDLQERRTEVHSEGQHRMFLEPVFVPKSDDAAEDEGWVMAYVFDQDKGSSDVVIIDAQDFTGEPIATIELPKRVPFGFHGNWVPDAS